MRPRGQLRTETKMTTTKAASVEEDVAGTARRVGRKGRISSRVTGEGQVGLEEGEKGVDDATATRRATTGREKGAGGRGRKAEKRRLTVVGWLG